MHAATMTSCSAGPGNLWHSRAPQLFAVQSRSAQRARSPALLNDCTVGQAAICMRCDGSKLTQLELLGVAGFMQQFADIVDEGNSDQHIGRVLERLSEGRKPSRVICTGHSLGGALASLGKPICRAPLPPTSSFASACPSFTLLPKLMNFSWISETKQIEDPHVHNAHTPYTWQRLFQVSILHTACPSAVLVFE